MQAPIIGELRGAFNAAHGRVRVVSFLSPTCGPCRYGQGVVRALFEAFPAHDLAGFIVWVPMLPTDGPETAQLEQDGITDARIRCWLDQDKKAANTWSSFNGYPGTTWDVYAVYDRSAAWSNGAPPAPRIWMHQLNETPATRLEDRLDVTRLAGGWLELVQGSAWSADDLALQLHERGRAVSERVEPSD